MSSSMMMRQYYLCMFDNKLITFAFAFVRGGGGDKDKVGKLIPGSGALWLRKNPDRRSDER